MFYLASPVKTHLFVTPSKALKQEWMSAINEAITTLIVNNPHLAGM
jgi:hypothetical protein